MEGSVELKKTRCDWRERKKKFQSIKSKTFFLLFEEQVWFSGSCCCSSPLKHSQVHQTLEAGIVSSRKYFPLYFNSHQKVIHLLERVAKKGREQDREEE